MYSKIVGGKPPNMPQANTRLTLNPARKRKYSTTGAHAKILYRTYIHPHNITKTIQHDKQHSSSVKLSASPVKTHACSVSFPLLFPPFPS
jgi:hypothetical protein